MIVGIGTDLVDIRRIEKILKRHGQRFEGKYFTKLEREQAIERDDKSGFYAKRFAAKEALVKALGSGFVDNIYLKDIGVKNSSNGKPELELSGGALARLNAITPDGMSSSIHLSLSDEPPYALGFVIIEACSS